ncbi:MAG: hypothetical protein ABII22_06820 [Candidatus Micrarchaeota archaeon]
MKKEEHKTRNLIISFFLIPILFLLVSFVVLVLGGLLSNILPSLNFPFSVLLFFAAILSSSFGAYVLIGAINRDQRKWIMKNLIKLYLFLGIFFIFIYIILPNMLLRLYGPNIDCTEHVGVPNYYNGVSFCNDLSTLFGGLSLIFFFLAILSYVGYFLGPRTFKEKG